MSQLRHPLQQRHDLGNQLQHRSTGVALPTATEQGYRGQTDVSGNVVYTVLSSGDIKMVDATTGKLIRDYYIGAPMAQGVSIGAAVNGQEYIIVPAGLVQPRGRIDLSWHNPRRHRGLDAGERPTGLN